MNKVPRDTRAERRYRHRCRINSDDGERGDRRSPGLGLGEVEAVGDTGQGRRQEHEEEQRKAEDRRQIGGVNIQGAVAHHMADRAAQVIQDRLVVVGGLDGIQADRTSQGKQQEPGTPRRQPPRGAGAGAWVMTGQAHTILYS